MNDQNKTKAQLIAELRDLRQRLADCQNAERAPLGTWVVDADFVVRVADQAMCRYLDKPAGEVVGSKCRELFGDGGCQTEECLLRKAFSEYGQQVRKDASILSLPSSCRVVGHLVRDRNWEAVGMHARIESAPEVEVEVEVPKPTSLARKRPCLMTVEKQQGVVLVAPSNSKVRNDWAKAVEKAGYEVGIFKDDRFLESLPVFRPTVAVLDLALGEAVADSFHRLLTEKQPRMPIIVVSSPRKQSAEAGRWRRACTWYMSRSARRDELVRLIQDLSSRPSQRMRVEH